MNEITGPQPQSFRRSSEGLRNCISNKIPGDVDAAGREFHFGNHGLRQFTLPPGVGGRAITFFFKIHNPQIPPE